MANLIFENIICTNCGSSNVIFENGIYTCNSCNSKFEKKQIDSKMFVELSIANQERQCTNFEKAKKLYEQIIVNYPNENLTDVYWGLFLCEQNVVFEIDGKGESFPSFFKISSNNALNNEKYLKAITYASIHEIEKAKVFAELGEKIENARKMYYDIKNTTDPFDVFICFKNTDSNGKYTSDRQLAMDIYNEFNGKYNIFFSEKTLKNIKSNYREYEPNIYYGLYTSKVMLLICSKKEYLESQWLKNEWSRFSSINKQGTENKCIIPIFTDNFNPDDLPDSLWHNQGIFDDRKLISTLETTLENIIHPIDKLEELRKEQERQKIEQERLLNKKIEELKNQNFVPNTTGVNLDNMINRGFQFLQDSEWDKAINQAEKAFDIDVTIPQGYIIEMMAEYKLNTLKDFNKLDLSSFDCNNYRNALKYADQDYKIEILNLKNENIYNRAIKLIRTDKLEAIKTFETILSYKDSQEKIEEIKEDIYTKAIALKNQKSYTLAINEFEKIKTYKDSGTHIIDCKNLPTYNKAQTHLDNKEYLLAINEFNKIIYYKDSSKKMDECKNLLYTNAKELMFNQKYDKAQTIFEQLSTFNDSKELAIECKNNHLYNKAKTLYEQAEFDKAIKCLNQIPNFLDSQELIKEYEKEKKYFSLKNYYNDEIHTIPSLKQTLKNITKEDMYYKRTEEIVKSLKQELNSKEKFKKLSIIVVSGILVILTLLFTYTGVIVPSNKYNKAIDYVNCQELDKAKDIFMGLEDYKDSQTMVRVINQYKQIELSSLKSQITNLTNLNAKIDIEFIVNHTLAKSLSYTKPTNNVSLTLEATHNGVVYKNWDIIYKGINVGKETKILIQLEPIYTITYSLNGGTNNSKNVDKYKQSSNSILLFEPTRTGYNFDGWYLNSSFTTKKIESIQTGTAYNITLYAKWSPITYTINYELNGGTQNSQNRTTYTIETETFTLQNPTKEYYDFAGWSFNQKIITQIEMGTTGNITLVANWTLTKYSITYELNGGKNNENNPLTYTIETETFILQNPTRTGYTFTGWTGTNLNGLTLNVTIEKGSHSDKTYTANWKVIEYTIAYELNGGTNNVLNPITYTIETKTFTLQNPTKEYYDFAGWSFNQKIITQIEMGTTGNITLVANWTLTKYSITYELNGGENNENIPLTYTIETETFTLQNPTRTGYTFTGWAGTNLTEKTFNVTISKGSSGNKNYIANWEVIEYTITYELNGGINNSQNPTSFTVENLNITLQNPTKENYYFEGWYLESSFETVIFVIREKHLENLTLYAKWILYKRSGDTITFGSYPQTKVTDNTITSALTSKAGTLPTSSNSYAWTDYGYYIENKVESYMWYIDLEYNTNKYRGVYYTSYRPYMTSYYSAPYTSNQADYGYYKSTVYWFKYEPITWTIEEESNGYATIVCYEILDSQDWHYKDSSSTINGKTVYANNYEYSHIRSWLNDTFYNTAFSSLEQAIIQTTTVDNSVSSTGYSSNSYACNNTSDKIFLLSYKEATKYYPYSNQREKYGTDYAKCQGLWVSTNGNGYWWLRSPYDYSSISSLFYSGGSVNYGSINRTDSGVLPALKIKL